MLSVLCWIGLRNTLATLASSKDRTMDVRFEIKSDVEFYCYLKAHLPGEYTIVSEPQKSYYSEWHFHYKIYHRDKLFEEYIGSFKDLEKGYLVREAKQVLESIGAQEC